MPDLRTTVTELGTALGMVPGPGLRAALERRPAALDVTERDWERLVAAARSGRFDAELAGAHANGRAFLAAADGLRGRAPRLIEWTGGRRPPGDEVAPIDLRIDHVYLVSCKYLSRTIANASPARVFDGLLATTGDWDRGDWYAAVAPEEHTTLYRACRDAVGLDDLPDDPGALTVEQRRLLSRALHGRSYPPAARGAYRALCRTVSERSADRWRRRLGDRPAVALQQLWRLLRLGNATYFLLGSEHHRALRLRIASPWDWQQTFRLVSLQVNPAQAGQPQVDWEASVRRRGDEAALTVRGHVEVRWSHGRFAQPPEAKIYLDTPGDQLPGYFPLGPPDGQLTLFGDDATTPAGTRSTAGTRAGRTGARAGGGPVQATRLP